MPLSPNLSETEAQNIKLFKELISIQGLDFSYASKKTISNVSIKIHKGEMTSIVGP